jgi:hypothetical protein
MDFGALGTMRLIIALVRSRNSGMLCAIFVFQ